MPAGTPERSATDQRIRGVSASAAVLQLVGGCWRTLRGALLLAALAALGSAPALATDDEPSSDSPRLPASDSDRGDPAPIRPVIRRPALIYSKHVMFVDPNPYVSVKEFSLFHNVVPAPLLGPGRQRELFHILYQRSGGPQAGEKMFGHAWSADLRTWAVDTLAFSVDTTAWNEAHVWSPSLVRRRGRDYLFYTGVDRNGDQSIGYVSAPLLDTTNTEWDLTRTQVLRARDTRWAVVDPPAYSGQTQFRDPFVLEDPEHPGQLLMFYAAHDSVSQSAGLGGLAVGVARSEPGSVDQWQDLGYYRRTLQRSNGVRQLEGAHAFRALDAPGAWWLMYSSAGTPPGEAGRTTIRMHQLLPGHSLADTSFDAWGPGTALMDYLHGEPAVFGWSGSEHLRLGRTDLLAGFTAWGPILQGAALARMNWSAGDFTLAFPSVLAVDEYRSPTRAIRMRVAGGTPGSRRIEFHLESAEVVDARLEVFDVSGRRRARLFEGPLSSVSRVVAWPWAEHGERAVEDGVYYARLSFPGGVRTASFVLAR